VLKDLLYSTNIRLMCNAAQRYVLILSNRSWTRLDCGAAIKTVVDVIEGNRHDSRDTEN